MTFVLVHYAKTLHAVFLRGKKLCHEGTVLFLVDFNFIQSLQ